MLINYRNTFVFFVLFLLFSGTYAASCSFSSEVTFQDGTKSCLENFPIAKEIPVGESNTVLDLVVRNHYFALASSKTSSCKAVGISYLAARGNMVSQSNKISNLKKEALDSCFNAGCDCQIIIHNLSAEVAKEVLEGQATSPVASNLVAAKPPPIESVITPLKNIGNSETSKANQNLSAASRDSEQIIALKSELEKLKTLLASNTITQEKITPTESKKSTPPIYANRYALVIGNDSYQKVPALQNAKEDARAMAGNLEQLGYKTTLKLDLTEKQMRQELRGFKTQLKAGDEVTFYYAGHGVQIDSTNFLLPIDIAGDSEDQVKDEAVSLQRVLDDMSEKKVKFTLALVDACRDNPFKGSGRSIAKGRGLAPTTAATGQMIVFSAGTGQQALDKLGPNDKSKNGLFTRVFMSEMHKEGVSIDRIVRNVRSDVVALAKSVGHDQVPAIYDQVVGEFYFKK